VELLDHLALGLQVALDPNNLLFCFLGVLLGTLVGILPGVGPTATIAMLLPITFGLSPETSLIMLAGIYYGAQYGGSTTAILINVPGETSSAVTAIDGHCMAQQGRAGPALAIAAIGSFFAGTVATLAIAIFALPLTELAIRFGPAEYFSLMLLGLVASVALAHGSVLKALAMIVFGLLAGLVGTDITSGAERFTLGRLELSDGLDVVAVAVGIFGVAEILRSLEHETIRTAISAKIDSLVPTRDDLRRSAGAILRGTGVGTMLGVLPGGGSILASFASYAFEKKVSKEPQRFGHGAIEGVAGPESANNAGAQTSFIPMLTLGIPSHPVMALMVGAMLIQGIVPGPSVVENQPRLFWGIIASMWIGNLMLVILNLPLVGLWVRLLMVPYHLLFPAILAFASIGVFSATGNAFDLYAVVVFGALGYLLIKLDCEPAPFLLGMVLGPMIEEQLRRAMIFSRGDPMIFLERPISAGLIVVTVAILALMFIPSVTRKRAEVFVNDEN